LRAQSSSVWFMQRDSVVSIIGGGPSAKNVDLGALEGIVIGVNDAGLLAPKVDIIISMDRLWAENRWPKLVEKQRTTYLRRAAMVNLAAAFQQFWCRSFQCDHTTAELSPDYGTLNGPNSGHCALNLAYTMKPKRIDLVGFDMGRDASGAPYWYKPYAWARKKGGTGPARYREWSIALTCAKQQCNEAGIEVRHIS
jgi:hypothetical protein